MGGASLFWLVRGTVGLELDTALLDGGSFATVAHPATIGVVDLAAASDGTLYWITQEGQLQSIKP